MGGEIRASVKVANGIRVYGKVFEMLARDGNGQVFVGAVSAQAGMEIEMP